MFRVFQDGKRCRDFQPQSGWFGGIDTFDSFDQAKLFVSKWVFSANYPDYFVSTFEMVAGSRKEFQLFGGAIRTEMEIIEVFD